MIAAPEYTDVWIDNRCRKLQDEAFYVAVLVAWRQGLENPPMIGVDTRPGTKNPKFVAIGARQHLHSQSFGGELLGAPMTTLLTPVRFDGW
jgi:hypothetical protein